ncbi:MAG: hypothetical protein EA383_00005, partial [Spirochaetaceae bacterium]
YRTHGIGKCHFAPDAQAMRGFQTRERQEEIPSAPDDDDYLAFIQSEGFKHVVDPHGVRSSMYYVPQVSQLPARLHPTQWVGDRACAFIKDQQRAAEKQPWYLYAGFVHPHPPFAPPAPWHYLYGIDQVPLPDIPPNSDAMLTFVNRAQNRYKYRDQGTDMNLLRMMRAYYYACISFIDSQVGRMLEALPSPENTLIVFSSDHGEYLGDFGCYGKRGMHDVSARVPMLAAHPESFAAGVQCARPVSLVDLAPTFARAAAIANEARGQYDGVALQDIAQGTSDRTTVYAQHSYTTAPSGTLDAGTHGTGAQAAGSSPEETRAAASTYMAVTEAYKYVYAATDDLEILFDRQLDPRETRNRAGAPSYTQALSQMRDDLIDHLIRGGETAGIEGTATPGTRRWKRFPRMQVPRDPDQGLLTQHQPWADLSIPGYT